MEELFKTVLSMSIGAGVLAAMVQIVRAVIGRRQTVVLTILFAMLIAKLIVPLSIESDASVFNLLPGSISQPLSAEISIDVHATSETTNNYAASSDSEPTLEHEKEAVQDTTVADKAVSNQPVIEENTVSNTVTPEKPIQPISPWQIAAIVWLCGMAALTVVITASNVAFIRKVNRNRTYTSPGFDELLGSCTDELGVKQKIRAVQMSNINTVAVCGIFRPKLLVSPETFDKLSMQEKKNVMMHELSHIKRKDTLTCLIITIVNILHWFNPIVWAAFAVFRKDIEVMCDAKVLRKMDNAGRRSYAHTLFTLAKNSGKTNTRFAMALFMSKATIKRRIAMIAKYKNNSPLIIALALTLVVGIAVTGCTTAKTDMEDVKEQDSITVEDTQIPTVIQDEFKNEGATNVPLGFQIASSDFGNCEGIFEEPSVHNVYKAIDMLNGTVFKPNTETILFDEDTINAENGWLEEPIDIGSFTLSSRDKFFKFSTGGREMVLGLVLELASSIGLYVGEFDNDGYFIHEKEAVKNVYDSDVVLRVWFDEKDDRVYAEFYCEDSDVKDKILASEVAPTLMTSYSLDYKSHMRENSQYNIEKALSMLNNSVVGPGEQLSLNAILGARTNENGWKETPGFSAGRYVSQIGGGVSAVATSLYNAALRSELKVVESSPHVSVTDYVDGGLDATISTVAPDLIIANPYQIDVSIKCRLDGNNIVVDIYGPPMEYTVDFLSIRVATMHAPEVVYHYNSETTPDGSPIAEGVSVSYMQSRPGHTCEVYKITYDLQGNEIERKLFDTVIYRPISEQIYINYSVPE